MRDYRCLNLQGNSSALSTGLADELEPGPAPARLRRRPRSCRGHAREDRAHRRYAPAAAHVMTRRAIALWADMSEHAAQNGPKVPLGGRSFLVSSVGRTVATASGPAQLGSRRRLHASPRILISPMWKPAPLAEHPADRVHRVRAPLGCPDGAVEDVPDKVILSRGGLLLSGLCRGRIRLNGCCPHRR